MLQLNLTPGPVPILLYPHQSADESALPPKDTIFTSSVEITAEDERIRIGSIIAVWQTSILRTEYPRLEAEGEWEVLHTIVVTLREGEVTLAAGAKESYVFDLTLSPRLPVSLVTPWERVSHVLHVFVLAPAPDYSVIPTIRPEPPVSGMGLSPSPLSAGISITEPPAPSTRRRVSLIESLRRLSLETISSRRSSDSQDSGHQRGKRKDKDKGAKDNNTIDLDLPQSQPPFPKLEEPYMAETHIPLVVTASLDAPGRVRGLESRRDLRVEGFGRIQLNMNSDTFIIGSAFHTCVYISNLDPATTLHAVRVNLTQRLTSVDGSTTHCDQYNLFQLGETYHLGRPKESDIVWRGSGARVIDRIARSKDKKRAREANEGESTFPDSDRIHITCAPRIPSWANGLRPSAAYHDPTLSTINHELDVSFFWSIDSLEAENSPLISPDQAGAIRTTSFRFQPIINSCAFLFPNIITPAYTITPAPQGDNDAYLEPYTTGTEPRSFAIKPTSWIEKDGKRQRLTRTYDQRSSEIRQHQLETSGLCACFYAEGHRAWGKGYRHTPLVVDGELDLAPFKPVKGGQANFEVERKKRQDEWWDVHKGERTAVPGFIHMLFDECACEAFRGRSVEGEGEQSNLADKQSSSSELG